MSEQTNNPVHMWSVQATTCLGGVVRQVPTFYLHPDVQGIAETNTAVMIALNILTADRAIVFDDIALYVWRDNLSRATGPETFKHYMQTGRVTL